MRTDTVYISYKSTSQHICTAGENGSHFLVCTGTASSFPSNSIMHLHVRCRRCDSGTVPNHLLLHGVRLVAFLDDVLVSLGHLLHGVAELLAGLGRLLRWVLHDELDGHLPAAPGGALARRGLAVRVLQVLVDLLHPPRLLVVPVQLDHVLQRHAMRRISSCLGNNIIVFRQDR